MQARQAPRRQSLRSPIHPRLPAPTPDPSAHRPPRRRLLPTPRPTPMGDRAHRRPAQRLPPTPPPLRTQGRALRRVRQHRRISHLSPENHQMRWLLNRQQRAGPAGRAGHPPQPADLRSPTPPPLRRPPGRQAARTGHQAQVLWESPMGRAVGTRRWLQLEPPRGGPGGVGEAYSGPRSNVVDQDVPAGAGGVRVEADDPPAAQEGPSSRDSTTREGVPAPSPARPQRQPPRPARRRCPPSWCR